MIDADPEDQEMQSVREGAQDSGGVEVDTTHQKLHVDLITKKRGKGDPV